MLRTIRDHSVGADDITVMSTLSGRSAAYDAGLIARAAGVILRAERSLMVHVHLADRGAYLRDPPLAALARARGLRVVISVHGHNFPDFAHRHPGIVKAALTQAQHVICLSDDATRAAALAVGPDRVTQLPNPIEVDRDAPAASETEPVVLFAGVVGRRKGVDVLIAAWRRLLERGIDARCRIVGPLDDYRPPALERLTVEGPADPRSIRELVRGARVVTLPSRSEQLPMVLTEAIAMARPFVATPVGGIPSLAVSDHMLVHVDDPDALAGAIARYLTDPALAALDGARAQAFCAATRSTEVVGGRYRAIYENCRSAGPTPVGGRARSRSARRRATTLG